MKKEIYIANRKISIDEPAFIIAEMSANHLLDFERAKKIIDGAKYAGADAIKLQTYKPETITIDSNKDDFCINEGLWKGTTLYKLYETAYTPWEWHDELKKYAESLGLICFSSPFDSTAVDLMEELDMPAYKVASFEITDIPMLRKIARLGKPIIISTGIAYLSDIEEALNVCKAEGNEQVILLKCSSAYPSPYEDINLNNIPTMGKIFNCIMGLSDHTLGSAVAVGSVALGGKVIEKHLTIKREDGGPDAAFSMEIEEFKIMVDNIRMLEKALGTKEYNLTNKQIESRKSGRSLYVTSDIKKGEIFTLDNVKSVRPGAGLHTRYLDDIIGKRAKINLEKGTPIKWDIIE
ncbi:MAG: pseudaminic acid synthase [Clostridium sp.]